MRSSLRCVLPLLVLIVLSQALTGQATAQDTSGMQDMQAYLDQTRAAVEVGQYPDALERFQWFYSNALMHAPAMTGVRNSYALSAWKDLGDAYPPALAALEATRDSTLQRLSANPLDRRAFGDLQALNRVLGDGLRTLATFEEFASQYARFGRLHWDVFLRRLALEHRRIDLLRAYETDVVATFERTRQMHIRTLDFMDRTNSPVAKSDIDRLFASQSLLFIQIALALDEVTNARTIQARALELVSDEAVRNAVPPE